MVANAKREYPDLSDAAAFSKVTPIRRASSRVSGLAAERQGGSSSVG